MGAQGRSIAARQRPRVGDRYPKKEGAPFTALKGCVCVDGDTYDIPKIIQTAELRQTICGGTMPTFGHRQKCGNDLAKYDDFSATTHVTKGKTIPPYLILYFLGNPDTAAQALRLEAALQGTDVSARALGKGDTNHSRLNDDPGRADDPASEEFLRFLDDPVGTESQAPAR